MSTETRISLDRTGAVPILRLARPHRRNAVDRATLQEVREALFELESSDTAVAVLAAEPPTFCAGSDYAEMSGDLRTNPVIELADTLLQSKVFWVAAVEGAALGGGVAVLAACPMVVAAQSATFALPERNLGLFPSGVLPYLEAVIGARPAFTASMSTEPFAASTASALGLVSEIATDGGVLSRALELAASLATIPDVTADARAAWQSLFACDHFRDRRRRLFDLLPQATPNTGANLRKEGA